MKYVVILFSLLFLTGCASSNFNKQKFTNLKHQSSYPENVEDSDNVNNQSDNLLTDNFSESENNDEIEINSTDEVEEVYEPEKVLLDDKEEFISTLKSQIEAGTKIIILGKDERFELMNPELDESKGELKGKLRNCANEPVDMEDLRIRVDEVTKDEALNTTIKYQDVKKIKGGKKFIADLSESDKNEDHASFKEVRQILIEDLAENPEHPVHKSEQYVKSKNLFLIGLCIFLPIIAVLALLAFVDVAFLFVAIIPAIIGFIVLSASIVNSRQYFIECRKKGIKPTDAADIIRGFSYLGLFLFSAVLLFGPAILVLLISNGIAKKRYKTKYGTES
ncbi:MAG: hypothetical protein BM555_00730 [Crocinitomix sp. MedPE-SWsnd]|nr:MAG: hypothetical protein BM555_00730 [Crocinitomix sp. MedPE-SWsnd]